MPPLYPKMRERPQEFRINYGAPLAEGLVFAGLGGHGCVGSMVYPDSSLYANHGTLTNMDAATAFIWDDKLRRLVLTFDRTRSQYVISTYRSVGVIHSIVFWLWQTETAIAGGRSKGAILWRDGSGIGACMSWFQPEMNDDYECYFMNIDGTRNSYVSVRGTGTQPRTWHHYVFVANAGQKATNYRDGVYYSGSDYGPSTSGTRREGVLWKLGDSQSRTRFMDGFMADILCFSSKLTQDDAKNLADPSNVDLRVGGIPLILPPRRRFWPVVSEQAIPKMVPWHLFQQVSA